MELEFMIVVAIIPRAQNLKTLSQFSEPLQKTTNFNKFALNLGENFKTILF